MEKSLFTKMEDFHFTYSGNFTDNEIQDYNFEFYRGEKKKILLALNKIIKI